MASIPISTMSAMLGASRGGFHAHRRRPPSARACADAEPTGRIAAFRERSHGTCGAPRIHADFAEAGVGVGRKRVGRPRRAAGVAGVSRRRFTRTTIRDDRVRPAADPVDRDLTAERPDALWAADVTRVATWTGFLHLAVVLDAFSRKIVGWAMGCDLRARLVIDAPNMAIGRRRPRDVVHRSDQGSRHASVAFGLRCKEAGVRPSMGSVGDACDDAMRGSVFATRERKLLRRRKFQTKAEARMAVSVFVEGWCNPSRRHFALGHKSPIEFERSARDALAPVSP